MTRMMNVVLFGAFITCTLFSTTSAAANATGTAAAAAAAAAAAKCDAQDNKGFAYAKCGTEKQEKCCHPKQHACVTATPWSKKGDAKELSVCSTTRALFGMKAVKVIIIPIFCEILMALLLVHMGKKFKDTKGAGTKPPILAVLCFVQVLLGFFVMLTEVWKFGVYDALLSVLVFHAAINQKTLPHWAFGMIVLLQLGNLVAILGPVKGTTDGVFLPLGLVAADGGTVSFGKKGIIDHLVPTSCSTYFEDYFKLESIELTVDGHDPMVTTFGLCTDEFIATVTTFITLKMVISSIMTAFSAQMLALKFISKDEPYTNVVHVGCSDAVTKVGA